MAEDKMNPSVEEVLEKNDQGAEPEVAPVAEAAEPIVENKKKQKPVEKKPNFFVRLFRKIGKYTKDVCGEMKKVVWTSKSELFKSTKLVVITVLAVCIVIALIDLGASWVINSLAGLIG